MLESSVLHQGRGGRGTGDGDAVGISWKAPTKSHPSPSLVVTCAHQVVVYQPSESRRSRQWSFKPSAATVLSHAAVFSPAGARYIGVQQGSTLVTWRESELDVKRPVSSEAGGAVQAVHACPKMGDYFVAVLSSGAISFYHAGLQRVASCDAIDHGVVSTAHSAEAAYSTTSAVNVAAKAKANTKVLWSGVRGNKVLLLQNVGDATDRLTTFVLSVGSPSSVPGGINAGGGRDGGPSNANASVTLVSSHVLTKPSRRTAGVPGGAVDEEASACSAAFLGGVGSSGGAGTVVSVAWRTSHGPMWTKYVVTAGGAREEFVRPAGGAALAGAPAGDNGATVAVNGINGGGVHVNGKYQNGKSPKSKRSKTSAVATREQQVVNPGRTAGSSSSSDIPAVAAADGGRLLVHSGGVTNPRLAIWDASYGVLLEDNHAPETTSESRNGGGGGVPLTSSGRVTRGVGMKVSGDGAHLALAVSGKVVICPLPVREAGTLASLLRHSKPSSLTVEGAIASEGGVVAFPSVDLAHNPSVSQLLLQRSGALEAKVWQTSVVSPFQEAETSVIQLLRDAARRKDADAFQRALRDHAEHWSRVGKGDRGMGSGSSDSREQDAVGEKRRKPGGGYSAGVVAAAVELCLTHPQAGLWSSLRDLIRSGVVSARHHRGLVAAIVEHASGDMLEEVMLHVPDLPEGDAVRILRHFLVQAADSAHEQSEIPPPSVTSSEATSSKFDENSGLPALNERFRKSGSKRRASEGGDGDVGSGDIDGVGVIMNGDGAGAVAVLEETSGNSGTVSASPGGKKKKQRKSISEPVTAVLSPRKKLKDDTTSSKHKVQTDTQQTHKKVMNGFQGKSKGTEIANGHCETSHQPDDGGTSGDSGGVSEGGTPEEGGARTGTRNAYNESCLKKTERKKRVLVGEEGGVSMPAVARAERAVRVALTLPHNEAFLRSALAGMSNGEVIVVLKVLTRLLLEGRTRESTASARGAPQKRGKSSAAFRGLPAPRTEAVVGWASAVLDSHFTRLAIGGAANSDLVGALKVLKKTARREAECCELLCQVRSLMDEVDRRHAAKAAEAADSRRRPKRSLFSLIVTHF